jgi:hypothetical protein
LLGRYTRVEGPVSAGKLETSLISIGANSGANLGRPLFFVILICIFVVVNLAKYRVIKSK